MTERLILVYAAPFSFVPEDSNGEVREGISCRFISGKHTDAPSAVGCDILKFTVPPEFSRKIKTAPALYEVSYNLRPGRGGVAQMRISDLTFIQAVVLDVGE